MIDAQLPPNLVHLLRQNGREAQHVTRLRLGDASDRAIWEYACSVRAAIVSKDADFLQFAGTADFTPPLVWVRVGNCTNAVLSTLFAHELARIVDEIESGKPLIELK